MANRKADDRRKSRGMSEGRSRVDRFLRIALLSLMLLAIIAILVFWFWPKITSWTSSIVDGAGELFGWGMVFIVMALGILAGLIRWRKQSSLIYRWNRWLSGIVFVLAIRWVLAFYGEGGSIGLGIIGDQDYAGILRLVGLVILGIILVSPRTFFRLARNFVSWLGKQFERKSVPRPARPQQPELPPVAETPKPGDVMPSREAVTPSIASTPAITPTQVRDGLRQVAEEVWKKYGKSPSLVTVDGWRLPPIDILDSTPEVEFSQADNIQRAKLIEEALGSYGVEAKVVQINAGPTVTQFGVEPGWDRKFKEVREKDENGNARIKLEEISKTRVKVDRIISLANDMALSLAAPTIRIEAPVPGKSVVGIEVPNTTSSSVSLRGVIETTPFQKIEARSKLSVGLGIGAGGEAVVGDLTRMPHLLIAGATGSGKTVCLNAIVCCLLLHNAPTEARFIMIDPKRVELTPYNSIPHLAAPVIVDTNKAIGTLRWLSQEMDRRYEKFAAAAVRNIEGFNKNRTGDQRVPYLVVIIDELADLMMAGFDEVEHLLCRLAQLARATGIHLVVATQRPSVDVVTGLIKANFPTRISFAVTSQVDSRTILDSVGAEKLLGGGDMLYMPTEAGKPKRLQGCYVSDAEIERLVYFWNSQQREEVEEAEAEAEAAAPKIEDLIPSLIEVKKESPPQDPLIEAARQLAQEHEHISTSYLQRKLRIGYPRAARIMEQLEEEHGEGEEGGGLVG